SLTNSLDTRNHLKIHTTFPSGQPGRPYLCINKLAPSVGPSTRSYSEEERVMANTTPLVTTVMKPTSNPGEANIAPRDAAEADDAATMSISKRAIPDATTVAEANEIASSSNPKIANVPFSDLLFT
nr:hypothetical protein [Tanacetum cinerariifolium]